jgi:hypothetical protein
MLLYKNMNFSHLKHIPKPTHTGNGLLNDQSHARPIMKGGHIGSTNLILGVSSRSSAVKTGEQVPKIQSSSVLDNLNKASAIIKGSGVNKKRNNIRIVF